MRNIILIISVLFFASCVAIKPEIKNQICKDCKQIYISRLIEADKLFKEDELSRDEYILIIQDWKIFYKNTNKKYHCK